MNHDLHKTPIFASVAADLGVMVLDVAPLSECAVYGTRTPFKPSHHMRRVSAWLATHPGASQREVIAGVQSQKTTVIAALRALTREGYVSVEAGPRGARRHTLIKPYVAGAEA